MRRAGKSTSGKKSGKKDDWGENGAETGGRRRAITITVRANGTATQREGSDSQIKLGQ
jgi:hypothetical protein